MNVVRWEEGRFGTREKGPRRPPFMRRPPATTRPTTRRNPAHASSDFCPKRDLRCQLPPGDPGIYGARPGGVSPVPVSSPPRPPARHLPALLLRRTSPPRRLILSSTLPVQYCPSYSLPLSLLAKSWHILPQSSVAFPHFPHFPQRHTHFSIDPHLILSPADHCAACPSFLGRSPQDIEYSRFSGVALPLGTPPLLSSRISASSNPYSCCRLLSARHQSRTPLARLSST